MKRQSLLMIATAISVGASNAFGTALASTQSLTIVDAYEGMAAYVEATRGPVGRTLPDLWRERVVKPYLERCAGNGEYFELAKGVLSSPIADLRGLTNEIAELRRHKDEIHNTLNVTFAELQQVLPGPDTTVCVFAADPGLAVIHDMGGIAGLTAGAGKIILQIRPEGSWTDWVAYTLAHEYHHSVWTARQTNLSADFDLTEALVFEGRADSFAHLVFPRQLPAWVQALTSREEGDTWEKMRHDLNSYDLTLQREYMFGDGGVPRWAGYTIGFHIVQGFLRTHPRTTVGQWTMLDAHKLLKESGYKPGGGSAARVYHVRNWSFATRDQLCSTGLSRAQRCRHSGGE